MEIYPTLGQGREKESYQQQLTTWLLERRDRERMCPIFFLHIEIPSPRHSISHAKPP